MRVGLHVPFTADALDRAQRLGADHVQLRIGPGFPLDLDDDADAPFRRAADELRNRGLQVGSLGFYRNILATDGTERRADHRRLRRVMRIASWFDTDVVGAFAGADPTVPPCPDGLDLQITRFETHWRPVISEAEDRALRLAFENCPMFRGEPVRSINFCHTPDAMARLLDTFSSPAVGLELDPSHLTRQHIDPVAIARRFAARTVHVHAKDHEHPPGQPSRDRFPGRGTIDFPAFFNALRTGGYRGDVTFEPEREPAMSDPVAREQAMAVAIAHLRLATMA